MSSSAASEKMKRGFGNFGTDTTASSLFDAAFSKPVPRRRFPPRAATTETEPEDDKVLLPSVSQTASSSNDNQPERKMLSPPVSLPESTSTDGNMEVSPESSDDEDLSLSAPIDHPSSLSSEHRRTLKHSLPSSSTYDFDDDVDSSTPPPAKRMKTPEEEEFDSPDNKPKIFPKKEQKPVYKHSWSAGVNSDDEDEFASPEKEMARKASPPVTSTSSTALTNVRNTNTRAPIWKSGPSSSQEPAAESYKRVRNVKEAHECLESGEHDDFKHDLEYILSSLKDTSASTNTKCLSTITLAKKCISPGFRQFIRSQGMINTVFRSLADAPSDPNFAICASSVVYLMCRDFISMRVDATSLRLLTNLLRMEKAPNTPLYDKFNKQVCDLFDSYLEKMEGAGKKIAFEIEKEDIAPSSLVLEALVFILARNSDEGIKSELLNLGALQWIVSKVEKIVLRLGHEKPSEEVTKKLLIPLERCFRILESCTFFHKKNQAFLISHRGSVLIHSCARLIAIQHTSVSKSDPDSEFARSQIACLSLMARTLMNLSHENELCCTKLGQIEGFLPLCLASFTFLAPKYAPEDKKFDLYVMMCSLLVNLVERCNSNRRKLIDTRINVFDKETGTEGEKPALEALAKLFLFHEAAAKTIDEDLEKDLVMEEPEDVDEEEEVRSDGRLDRGKIADLSETEMVMHVQSAMNKASAHMEDSVVASYVALLIGCLLQQNEDAVNRVRDLLPGNKLDAMIDQLTRFLEFMKIAAGRKGSCRSIERIIDNLERLNIE